MSALLTSADFFYQKGFIEAEKKKVLNTGPSNLPKTKAVIDEEKMRYVFIGC